jgi:hypothetical protein
LKAQEELEKVLTYYAMIEEKTEDLFRLDSIVKRVTAATGGDVVSKSKEYDPQGKAVANKENAKRELVRLQVEYERQRVFLSSIIDGLKKPAYIKILYGLYFNGKELTEIADQIGYTYRHTQDLRDGAIQSVQKIMDEIESSHKIS